MNAMGLLGANKELPAIPGCNVVRAIHFLEVLSRHDLAAYAEVHQTASVDSS